MSKIIRPFIEVTKDEILAYNKKHRIKYALDSSNEKDVYTRNRFRKYIVPQFKKEEPNVHEKFLKFSKTLIEYNTYIDGVVKSKMNSVYPQDVLNIEKFLKEDKVIQLKIIYAILEKNYQDDLMLICDKHAEILLDVIHSKRANVRVHLPNNIQAIKSYDTLVLSSMNEKKIDYNIEINKFVNLPNGKNLEVVIDDDSNNNFVCRLNSSEIKLPLSVRNRKDGDKISIKGMLGRKKIKDIFIDEKIALHEREIWPVVVDADGNIVWIPGLKKSKFDKTKTENYDIILRYY